ncbi:MAG TPA: response regulator transcription factor [Niabella sp.]|uniref:DNA-binding response regulator n=1 Tax=Chryseobacterium indologenes TaxID=253 RepID=A0AAD0YV70_CHRID|nr:response regulator transcription factor [Chryseobacterium indologenes]AZB17251.1 DNA-binding response regulator [Chryseobacterium indologenes]HMR81759.1 response regulator transcription factor [Niabella sp.]
MRLLVIEDESDLLQSILEYFKQEDFRCEGVMTFYEGIERVESFDYDCIILDINLPDGNGLKLLKHIRENKKQDGVIIISARNSLDDKVEGLLLGADDYVTKPFHLSELNARVKALIRRKYNQGTPVLEVGSLQLNLLNRQITCRGEELQFTRSEFDLLAYLLNNANRVVSRQAIAEHLYGDRTDNMPSFDFVYSQIKNLKRKLKESGCDELIQTVYGLGYKISL